MATVDDKSYEVHNDDLSHHFNGTHEVLECPEDLDETEKHDPTSKCNKPHDKYILVKDLSPRHFPYGYQDNDLVNFTKLLSDLTVRISISYVSPDRPQFISGTSAEYPGYKNRGKKALLVGTGKVWDVVKYAEDMDVPERTYRTCPCPKCLKSDTPEKVWWEAVVLTARHVVYDGEEASRSKCRLWYDSVQTPVVNIYGFELAGSYSNRDNCMFFCATHDLEVGEKLQIMLDRFEDLWSSVWKKYKDRNDEANIVIIVSHPHGNVKKVSVGHWVDRQEVSKNITRYTYTNSTCAGSSGALVYRLGYKVADHPHSGTNPTGLNYSGLEVD
ncbi:uncharacterized protein LOC131950942 [Physella acuta]|uniref:uncharacterized protein LOC131950942 n=1 Tax=Physella acuta TaxID=109671 RepID=UPI0027DB1284|nr:uncharacterized protein LOC131950942 [Physella acuta]